MTRVRSPPLSAPPFPPYHPLVTRGVPHDTWQVAPSLRLATRIGPQHTVATYTNITSLMIHAGADKLVGKTLNCYSYGSGAAATMFRLRVKRMPGFVKNMHEVLRRSGRTRSQKPCASLERCERPEHCSRHARPPSTAHAPRAPRALLTPRARPEHC